MRIGRNVSGKSMYNCTVKRMVRLSISNSDARIVFIGNRRRKAHKECNQAILSSMFRRSTRSSNLAATRRCFKFPDGYFEVLKLRVHRIMSRMFGLKQNNASMLVVTKRH